MADTSNDIYNLYKECRECGDCCRLTVISMTRDESELITEHITANGIQPLDRGPGVCPFQDEDNRCMVYPVRPRTCRLHNCTVTLAESQEKQPEIQMQPDASLLDMRMAFIHGEFIDPSTMPEEWIIKHYSE